MLLVFALFTTAFAANWEQLPVVWMIFGVHPEDIQKDFATLHPWKPGDPLPTNFAEAGLKLPVELVGCEMYLDGGSIFYIFRGSNSKYLMVCTDSGSYGVRGSDEIKEVKKPRLFLAAGHFKDKNKVVVPFDSKCERFLITAIKDCAARAQALQKSEPNRRCECQSAARRLLTPPSRHHPASQVVSVDRQK